MKNPFLPSVGGVMRASRVRALGFAGADLYFQRLCYAQSLLSEGKPAQAILQLNRAFAIEGLSSEILEDWPRPYAALRWILQFTDNGFLGNPVRHFQHYATRMSGPNAAERIWRAWACFHIAEKVLDSEKYPRDLAQITNDAISIPSIQSTLKNLDRLGLTNDVESVSHYY